MSANLRKKKKISPAKTVTSLKSKQKLQKESKNDLLIRINEFINSPKGQLVIIILLILLNPLLYLFNKAPYGIGTDSIFYTALADSMFKEGLLYVPQIGHIDQALISPPLLPFLTYCVSKLGFDILNSGIHVSTLCMLLSSIPVFFLINHFTNRFYAFAGTLFISWTANSLLFGLEFRSESTFILTTSLSFLLLVKSFANEKNNILLLLLTGMSIAF